MSGDSYRSKDDRIYGAVPRYTDESVSETDRRRLFAERREEVEALRREVVTRSKGPRPVADTQAFYDSNLVRSTITRPAIGVKKVYIVLIDNSGSNRAIANHFRKSTSYLTVNLELIEPDAQFVFVYFSDHCDGRRWWQGIDFVTPNEEGQKILTSTLYHVSDADGDDAPEAHECALWDISHIDFGEADQRHLILISDVTGHGMGMHQDNGCPNQRSWQDSMDAVDEAYQTFEMIGCGDNPNIAKLQQQFITYKHPENLEYGFISLAHVKEHQYRMGIVLNSFLFVVARQRGLQTLEAFLSRLYEKWLKDPLFGGETDRRAKEAILRFAKYIPGDHNEKLQMLSRVLVSTPDELEKLLAQGAVLI